MRYHQIVGMTVVSADGERVGRVADLAAEGQGDELRVTDLLVGPAALLRRTIFGRHYFFRRVEPHRVPWRMVDRIDDRIHLGLTRDQWDALRRADVATTVGAEERRR